MRIFIIAMILMLAACEQPAEDNGNTGETEPNNQTEVQPEKKPDVKSRIMQKSGEILVAISKKDFKKLSLFAHPEKGITFSPYGYISKNAKTFSASGIKSFEKKDEKVRWGNAAGSGKPIELTPKEYFDQYVYDADFLDTDMVSYNTIMKKGNSKSNIKQFFPDSNYVEYYVPGTEEYDGMDWKSLKLVFKEYEGKQYIVGIVHDKWTP
ncbi:hypothetical protein [Pseudalkalibacillus caeni]|uniref:Lipoprotein n=1 Tax=Exobacillus caeni TaxID=2574798 RepID=A0A5R9F8J7_9BACL|nr:hypothetical protein [Pseudalkalibacillus caeni]TLS37948.1 hypothetical protein FCL54_09025 [Pseudalkalibacillus caeni]